MGADWKTPSMILAATKQWEVFTSIILRRMGALSGKATLLLSFFAPLLNEGQLLNSPGSKFFPLGADAILKGILIQESK